MKFAPSRCLSSGFVLLLIALNLSCIAEAEAKKKCESELAVHNNHKSHRYHKHHHKHGHKSQGRHHHATVSSTSSSSSWASAGAGGAQSGSQSSSSSNADSGSVQNTHGGPAPGAGDNPTPKGQQNQGTPTQAISHGTPSKSPKGGKAGVAGGESLKWTAEVLGWWHNWGPVPDNDHAGNIAFMSTCWGIGQTGGNHDAERFEKFKKVPHGKYPYVAGYNEMDFQGHASSGGMSLDAAVHVWEQYIAPHKAKGSILVSPSCAKQKDEDMCGKFLKQVKTKPDLVNLHIFQEHPDGVKPVIDHYRAYGYKMIITELACINVSRSSMASIRPLSHL
ncbi:hypothetical protein IE81DRAFT_359845 [Ceraceosorus guamensis]|uniref:Asl1-like glycosyl hydrolase catalytic domain-containing protein n=1 Tax=Ceraceosorus guamensis TaxID=1522189 RepID=A0A316W6V4_9BASI|nr:hypothetical protein IE81DRAFT_359845 [Ceraceosorus guamensis]PWN45522.1 hypothetical protein IE81DRAFT_359845 [Ceraceosorus guamensis]